MCNRPQICDQGYDTTIVPAWDEHFRRNENFVENNYMTACEGECGKVIEGMHGGGGGGGRGGGGRGGRGGRGGGGRGGGGYGGGGRGRPFRGRGYYGGGGYYGSYGFGWPWGWTWPSTTVVEVPVERTVVERPQPIMTWLLLLLVVMALFYFASRRK